MNRFKLIILMMLPVLLSKAQQSSPEMADALRQDGKFYVVVSVIAIIFVSLVIFLIYLERRISKLDRKQDHSK
jgi:hypothetical protein